MTVSFRPMKISDYESVYRLFSETPGVTVRDADSLEATSRYLQRNPGLSFVALSDGNVIGCILCGHDGRRGYLQHLVVLPESRGQGVAKELVGRCLEELLSLGINKSHVDVLVSNSGAQGFWSAQGWQKRDDIYRFSFISAGGADA